jgi:hypothetical protein
MVAAAMITFNAAIERSARLFRASRQFMSAAAQAQKNNPAKLKDINPSPILGAAEKIKKKQ